MYIALNSKKQRIHISESIDGDKYYCPVCNEEVIKRKGTINAHHYAHKNNSHCLEKDGWHYDMSDWHYDWQNQFPVENQEVVFKSDNKIHRADVFIKDTVLEFQHSPITEEEFNELKTKCKWTWGRQDGHSGYKVTGPNGNSIFLPAAGWCDESDINRIGNFGAYWSSSLEDKGSSSAYGLFFTSESVYVYLYPNYTGRTIRPVRD